MIHSKHHLTHAERQHWRAQITSAMSSCAKIEHEIITWVRTCDWTQEQKSMLYTKQQELLRCEAELQHLQDEARKAGWHL